VSSVVLELRPIRSDDSVRNRGQEQGHQETSATSAAKGHPGDPVEDPQGFG
jgi:hypothetical protein